VKSALCLGRSDYQWQREPILYGWADGAGHLWCASRTETTVWDFRKPKKSPEHPTTKPGARAPCRSLAIAAGSGDDLEDLHPPAALGADRHVDGEDPGEERSPADAARCHGRLAELIGKSWDETERELHRRERLRRGRDDPSAEAMSG